MRKLFTFISLIAAIMSYAQTTQTGLVQEYNERAKKTPLSGVELNVRSAGNTVSDKNGKFSLQFLTLKPGEKVNVRRIEKLGYEIFNKEAVEQWNINPKTPFVIIMCKADRFKKIRDNYEKVSSESYARQLKKEEAALAKLKQDGKLKEREYEQKLIELRENYDKQLDNLENYVDRFSRIDLSEISSVEQEIIGLVQEGKIEEAIAKYEEQNFVTKYKQEVDQLKEISSAIDQLSDTKTAKEQSRDSLYAAIDRQIETLRLAGGTDNINKIEVILHDVAYSDTTATAPMWKYLEFMASQNKYRKIEDAFNTFFNQNMPNHDRIKGMELRVRSFINMADYSGHESLFTELDSLLDFEVKQDSSREFLFDDAKLYYRIGGFYMESDQISKALPYLKKAVVLLPDSIVLPIINENLECFNTYLQAYTGYAYANFKIGNKDLFKQTTLKLKDIVFHQINQNISNPVKLNLARSAADIGQLLELNKYFAEADSLYNYTKAVYDEVVTKDPKRYLPSMAHIYMVMGILYQKTDRFIDSERAYLKAIDCYTSLALDLPKNL